MTNDKQHSIPKIKQIQILPIAIIAKITTSLTIRSTLNAYAKIIAHTQKRKWQLQKMMSGFLMESGTIFLLHVATLKYISNSITDHNFPSNIIETFLN